jgi:hypothetical protein
MGRPVGCCCVAIEGCDGCDADDSLVPCDFCAPPVEEEGEQTEGEMEDVAAAIDLPRQAAAHRILDHNNMVDVRKSIVD